MITLLDYIRFNFENKQIMEWSEKHLSGISLDMILSAAKGWVEVNDEQRR